jgi:hypothetical protein
VQLIWLPGVVSHVPLHVIGAASVHTAMIEPSVRWT